VGANLRCELLMSASGTKQTLTLQVAGNRNLLANVEAVIDLERHYFKKNLATSSAIP
jgi:hypothetical protein